MTVEAAEVDRHDGARKGGAGRQGDAKCNRTVAESPYHPRFANADAFTSCRQALPFFLLLLSAAATTSRVRASSSSVFLTSCRGGLLFTPKNPWFLLANANPVMYRSPSRESPARSLARPLVSDAPTKVRVTPRGGSRKVPRPESTPLRLRCVCMRGCEY